MNIKEFIDNKFSTMPENKDYIILEIRNDKIRQMLIQAYNHPNIRFSDKTAYISKTRRHNLCITSTPFARFKSRYERIVHDISDNICIRLTKPIKIYKKD